MRILHFCLSCFYIDDYNYQENILPRIHFEMGHDVKIVASTETFIDNSLIGYVEPSKYKTNEGIEIVRIPYKKYLPRIIMRKIRHYECVKNILEDFKADVIMFHGVPAYELLTVCKYKKKHPSVKLYVDSHEDEYNSGTNFVSKNILHKLFYKWIVKRCLKFIDKVLYLSLDCKKFLRNIYDIPEDLLELYPLGGVIVPENKKVEFRHSVRQDLGLRDDEVLLCHSGKMIQEKRTYEMLVNFSKIKSDKMHMILIGTLSKDVEKKIMRLIENDNRISFLGWKSADELIEFIAASDLYVQPGSQSATMQNALCVGTPVLFKDVESHQLYMEGNAFIISEYNEMEAIFNKIAQKPEMLNDMSIKAYKLARRLLDYKILAERITR